MPWNNNSGGGGWKGGGGGPWGGGPQQRGPQPPDLEELLQRSQDRLRNVLPSGGGRSNALVADPHRRGAGGALALQQPLHGAAGRARAGARLRQAEARKSPRRACISSSGRSRRWRSCRPRVQREFLGSDDATAATRRIRNLMLSADQNIVEINFSVLWRVGDPKKFLFNVNEPAAFLRRVCGKRHARARRPLDRRAGAHRAPRRGRRGRAGAPAVTLDTYNAGIIDRRRAARARRSRRPRWPTPSKKCSARSRISTASSAKPTNTPTAGSATRAAKAAQVTETARWLQAAGRGGGGGRVAALPLRAEGIRAGRGRDAQAALPRDRWSASSRAPTRSSWTSRAGVQGVLPYLPLDQLQRNRAARAAAHSVAGDRDAESHAGPDDDAREHANEALLRCPDRPRWSSPSSSIRRSSSSTSASRRIVLRFGEIKRVIREPGIYFKIPTAFVDTVQIIDDRLLSFDLEDIRVQVRDGRRYIVDAFVAFRSPTRGASARTSPAASRSRARTCAPASMRRSGGLRPAELRGGAFGAARRHDGRGARPAPSARHRQVGIDIVDVRIKRTDLLPEVSQQTFERMKAERLAEAAQLRARGTELAARIRAEADREAVVTVAEAEREAEILRGEGDAERSRVFAEAYQQDPDFFEFYRSMRAYSRSLERHRHDAWCCRRIRSSSATSSNAERGRPRSSGCACAAGSGECRLPAAAPPRSRRASPPAPAATERARTPAEAAPAQ